MTPLAYLALFGWVPIVVVIFAMSPGRSAATVAVIGAWLLLPPYSLNIAGLPDYSKITAASIGIGLGTLLFHTDRLLKFRPRWFDLPMLGYCLSGIFSSLQNGLGLYDGLSDSLAESLTWGLPYVFGRLYFSDLESLGYFGTAMVIGALCYVPLCLYEMRMMNSLLIQIYGMGEWGALTGLRLGGYRPNVFFYRGLELGLWMTAASLAGWWLWRCGVIKRIGQVPFGALLLPVLLITTILCRSTGALLLLVFGMLLIWLSARFRTRLLMASLLLAWPVYIGVRANNLWSGQQAVDLATTVAGPERAESLEFRFKCENLIVVKALQQPMFGWGGWGRSTVYFEPDSPWRRRVPTDGLWVIILGSKGYFGLIMFYFALVLPVARFIHRFPARLWGDPRLAGGLLATVMLTLYMVDCLMNGFVNIIYVTLAGGLSGLDPRHLGASTHRHDRETAVKDKIAVADRGHKLGQSLKAEGRFEEAEALWRRSLDVLGELSAVYPDFPELRQRWCDCANDLAWLKLNESGPAPSDPATAIELARRATEVCPEDPTYWNTLGAAYYRAGQFNAAIEALDHGDTAFDHVFLAMAHARLGNHEEAERRLAKAIIRMEPDYPGHIGLNRLCDEARSVLASLVSCP